MEQVSLIDGHIDDVRGDLISRSALIAEYDRVHIGAPGGARKLMKNAHAVDAVPVVRCKDCKYRNHDGAGKPWCDANQYYLDGLDFFCAYGERRTDDEK